jgi:S-formylglutathione hydrolase FrmB
MNLDLLSQNLILIICSLVTAVAVYLISRLFAKDRRKAKPKKRSKKQKVKAQQILIICTATIAVSILAAFILKLLFGYWTDSPLPDSFIFMVLPFTLSLTLLALAIRFKPKLWIIASGCVFCSLIFSLLIVNNYYRFYPTLGELFNKNANVEEIGRNQRGIYINFSHSSSSNHPQTNTLETELSSVGGQTTAGKVYSLNIPGTVSKFKPRGAYVYVPAVYSTVTDINLPVIVLTTGYPGLPENWLGSGLENTMDQFAHTHEGITPLVFMVDNSGSLTNDTECVNSSQGNVESYLTTDVPNFIKAHFRVINNPANWAIGGLSMGGMCSVMLTLRHPDVFHYFMDYGGEIGPEIGSKQKTVDDLFSGSESAWAAHQPDLLLTTKNYKNLGLGGFFGDGNEDSLSVTQAQSDLVTDSQNAGIETISETINGPHTFNVWQQLFKDSLPWVSNRIGATQCGSVCI